MGNRAVLTLDKKIGIYMHWNGGMDTIKPILKYCKLRRFRQDDYGIARLTQVIANFLGGDLSLGVGSYDSMDKDNFDNGVYVIGNDWEITERLFHDREEQDEYNIYEMLKEIDEKQPENDRIFNTESVEEQVKKLENFSK